MSNLLTRIADALTGPKKVEPELLTETVAAIREAEDRLATHERDMATAREKIEALTAQLDSEAGPALEGGTAAKRYDETARELAAVKDRAEKLERAHRAAGRDLAELRLAQNRLTHAESRKAISKIANQRAVIAEALVKAIGETVKHWTELYETTERLKIAYPGGILPSGSLASRSALFRALEVQFWKSSGKPFRGAEVPRGCPSLPGANCHDVRLEGNPSALPSIADAVNVGNSVLLDHMNGEAARVATLLDKAKSEPEPASKPAAGNAGEVGAIEDDGLGELVTAPKPAPAPKTRTAAEIQATIPKRKLSV